MCRSLCACSWPVLSEIRIAHVCPRDFFLSKEPVQSDESRPGSDAVSARAPFFRSVTLQGSSGSGGLRGGRAPCGVGSLLGPGCVRALLGRPGGVGRPGAHPGPGVCPPLIFRSLASNPGFVLRCRDSVYQMSQVWGHELQEFKGRGWPCFTGSAAFVPAAGPRSALLSESQRHGVCLTCVPVGEETVKVGTGVTFAGAAGVKIPLRIGNVLRLGLLN